MKRRERKSKRIKKEKSKRDLKIYSSGGELIYIAKEGFCVDYQELAGAKRRKSKYSHFREVS